MSKNEEFEWTDIDEDDEEDDDEEEELEEEDEIYAEDSWRKIANEPRYN